MAEVKTHAVVLRSRDYREADKLVTLLTQDGGKITAVARGVRKIKSKLKALVEPLTLGYFLLHTGKSLDTLTQGEIVKPYSLLQADLVVLTYAQYFCELCESALPEREPAREVFNLLIAALQELEEDIHPVRVARCFELNLLDVLGYRPVLECCLQCENETGPFNFDPQQSGLICGNCISPPGSFAVSGAAVAIMKRFLDNGFYRLSICALPPTASEEIRRVSSALLAGATGRTRFKTLELLNSFEELK
jgi:DNA repair protein RecO (recombination protein O)